MFAQLKYRNCIQEEVKPAEEAPKVVAKTPEVGLNRMCVIFLLLTYFL